MLEFGSLWLQVLLVGVATFVLASVFWTAMPWHKTEFKPLPDEEAVRKVLLASGVNSGQWRLPFCTTTEESKSPEFQQKMMTGPMGILQFMKPGPMSMGAPLIKTFLLFLFIAFFTGYVLRTTQAPGVAFLNIFRVAFCVSFAAHAIGHVQDAIWFGKSWERVLKQGFDSVVYAAATGAIFAGMWPEG